MSRAVFIGFAALLLLGFSGALANAQTGANGVQGAGGLTTAAGATASPRPNAKAVSEPAELAGMLAAQNDARARLGVPVLTWSTELTAKAAKTAKAAAIGSCSSSVAEKVGKAEKASIFWAAGIRRLGSAATAQDISASFLISRWNEGRNNYDVATGLCRTKAGNCEQFSRMVAPKARAVGCARVICANQTQIWACQYSE
jgi:pathogenesis-related protein 1